MCQQQLASLESSMHIFFNPHGKINVSCVNNNLQVLKKTCIDSLSKLTTYIFGYHGAIIYLTLTYVYIHMHNSPSLHADHAFQPTLQLQ
jgi:hypothetical protein